MKLHSMHTYLNYHYMHLGYVCFDLYLGSFLVRLAAVFYILFSNTEGYLTKSVLSQTK
jgi:hypothetical protein